MHKFKLLLISLVGLVLLAVKPVFAFDPAVSITKLPEYMNTNTFKLSYSALTNDPSSINAQFYYRKEGGSYIAFGPTINSASGEVQVTGSQITEQAKYYFKVEISGASDETYTFFDTSGPSPVSGYSKDTIDSDDFKLHWRNPNDSDFSHVIIYRGETVDFSADNNHQIAKVYGSPNSDMTYDEHTPDANKTYYYALRAVDKAGNSSSLAGDGSTTLVYYTPTPQNQTGSTSTIVLPKEERNSEGSVLSSEVDSEEKATEEGSILNEVSEKLNLKDNRKIYGYILAGIIAAISVFYYFKNKKRS